MKLSDKTYNILKDIALIWLPAIVACYITLANLWEWPYVDQISGTIVAIDTLLGALLKISTNQYNKANSKTEQ